MPSNHEHTCMVLELLRRMKVESAPSSAGGNAPSAKKGAVAAPGAAVAVGAAPLRKKRAALNGLKQARREGKMPPVRRNLELRTATARPVADVVATANPIASNRVIDGMELEMAEFDAL